MRNPLLRLFLLLSAMILILVGCGKDKLPVLMPAPDFHLEDADGKPVSFSDQDGKVRLVSFIYTNCTTVCPATVHWMVKLQDELKKENLFGSKVYLYNITFDPENDTGEVIKAYMKKWKMDPTGWAFLRGSVEDTRKAAADFGVLVQKVENDFIHTDRIFLVDGKGEVRKTYVGSRLNLPEVLKDMKDLVNE
ncbi:SCO1/SenC/PrrC protein [[Clostridium] ultunense Esp]|nr:SCO1/SenC/PrrC protein [[Clostridium] ultunense Esp]